jgi:hypothetical protein
MSENGEQNPAAGGENQGGQGEYIKLKVVGQVSFLWLILMGLVY